MIEITSDVLRVQIDEEGAQLRSIYHIVDEIEYLWQRDSSIWASSSPVVFPVIGKLHNLSYKFDHKTYHMKSNGLIRYEKLTVTQQDATFVELALAYTNETYEQYPFAFLFTIRYEVKGEMLYVQSTIQNLDDKTLYYNYAGHPGFNIGFYKDESCNDYYIEFEENECVDIYDVCESGQLLDTLHTFLDNEKRFFLRKQLFEKEALVFSHPRSHSLSINSLHHNKKIIVNYEGFDNIAIWSPYYKDKPLRFICVEPWIGHTDFYGYTGDFTKRDEVAHIAAKQKKVHTYCMQFL